MAGAKRKAVPAAVMILVLSGAGLYWLRNSKRPASPRDSGYVDAAACAACHPDIAATYRRTGMGRSFFRPRPESTIEDYAIRNVYYHQSSDRHYTSPGATTTCRTATASWPTSTVSTVPDRKSTLHITYQTEIAERSPFEPGRAEQQGEGIAPPIGAMAPGYFRLNFFIL